MTCTYVLDMGEWPYLTPTRCGQPAVARVVQAKVPLEEQPEAFTCEGHRHEIMRMPHLIVQDLS